MSLCFHCGSIVAGCNAAFHGDQVGDIVIKMREHLEAAHEGAHLDKDLVEKIKAGIVETKHESSPTAH